MCAVFIKTTSQVRQWKSPDTYSGSYDSGLQTGRNVLETQHVPVNETKTRQTRFTLLTNNSLWNTSSSTKPFITRPYVRVHRLNRFKREHTFSPATACISARMFLSRRRLNSAEAVKHLRHHCKHSRIYTVIHEAFWGKKAFKGTRVTVISLYTLKVRTALCSLCVFYYEYNKSVNSKHICLSLKLNM